MIWATAIPASGFFEQVTPIEEITRLRLGSRPARHGGSQRIEELRAIPWVFSWTQTRILLPGWYGLGSALAQAATTLGCRCCARWTVTGRSSRR